MFVEYTFKVTIFFTVFSSLVPVAVFKPLNLGSQAKCSTNVGPKLALKGNILLFL